MTILRLENIGIQAGSFSLHDISLEVDQGCYFMLLGPSGAGKSLILETVAGFYRPVKGKIFLKDKEITNLAVQERNVGLLFQDFAVFPHMSVFSNIAYPLHGKIKNKAELRTEVERLAVELGIDHLLGREPATLSGGEQQRVALARTLAKKPGVLLLDEPLSSLDVQLRGGLRALLRKINQQGQTILHVTHDYEEAAILGHRIGVVENRTITQTGTHQEVFHHPKSGFVANFVGIRNFFGGNLIAPADSTPVFMINGQEIKILTDQEAGKGFAIIRSEDIFLSLQPLISSAANNFKGIITAIEPSRSGFEVFIDAGIPFTALITHDSLQQLQFETGIEAWLSFKASAVRFIPE
jgi:molybdopterin-binding protein